MRIVRVSHGVFALTLIGIGVLGLIQGDLTAVWDGVPKTWPVRAPLGYLCGLVSLGCGIGLLWQRRAALAARVLLGYFVLWMLLFKLRFIVIAPLQEIVYQTNGVTAVYVAGAWILYTWLPADWDRQHLAFATGERGVRIARVLYGLAMIGFGFSHFAYFKNTYTLVPAWLLWPFFWSYFTGCAYLAAAAGILSGVCARLAATLAAVQMGSFIFLVWLPLALSGKMTAFNFGELVSTCMLTAAGWVVADSYRGLPWFGFSPPWRVPHKSQ